MIDPRKAAEELADEAMANGNDWEAMCKPRLEAILAALDAARSEAAKLHPDCQRGGCQWFPTEDSGLSQNDKVS